MGGGGWEDRGREGGYGTFGEWGGARKGEIIGNVNKLYQIRKKEKKEMESHM